MVFLKLLLALPRLAMAVFKLALKLMLVFTVLGFIFGIKAGMVIMAVVTVFLLLIFIYNLFSVLTEDAQYTKSSNSKSFDDNAKLYDDHDYWTPGQPNVTQKAFTRGFFP